MSSNDPTDIWAWTSEDAARLQREGGAKQTIADSWSRFNSYRHRDAVAADRAICRALEAARAEGELRWELLLRHWRLQLWLNHDLRTVLPQAKDLLSLATDERLHDVPERICAVLDLVECYVRMDGAGYYEEVVAKSENVLAQLPERHPCASCTRLNMAGAASAAGRTEEAEQWIARFQANLHRPQETCAPWSLEIAQDYESLGKLEEAERRFSDASADARRSREQESYIYALLGLARVQARTGKAVSAAQVLGEALHFTKYSGGSYVLARLVEAEGWVAEAAGHTDVALDYFVRAAKQYLELGRYRFAALASLHATELWREQGVEGAEAALEIAALAVGAMPPASQDVYQRLERLGRRPVSGRETTSDSDTAGADGQPEWARLERQELAALEGMLDAHLHTGNPRGVATALYRLGHWYSRHDQPRAALDYLIANAVLERMLQLSMDDREDALNILKGLRPQLPPGTISAALAAAAHGPSALLTPLLDKLPAERWRWLVQSVADELEDRPVVEPEPLDNAPEQAFESWLEHAASMTVLIVRFRKHIDADRCKLWVSGLDEMAEDIDNHLGPSGEGHELATLARGLADLARGAEVEAVGQQVLPPFNPVIEQVEAAAKLPVWQHPGSSPLDFLAEQAAQRAVRGLRIRDERRSTRLANLAWRFELMTLDLAQHEQTQSIGSFLTALRKLMLADGELTAVGELSLPEPFGTILSAVSKAGGQQDDQPAQAEDGR